MNQTRQQLLAGTALGFQQNVGIAARRLPRLLQRVSRTGELPMIGFLRASVREPWEASPRRTAEQPADVVRTV